MRSSLLRMLALAGFIATVAVSGQDVSSSTGGIDEFEVSSSSAGVDVGTNEVFSSSAVGEALIVVESSSSASSAEMTVDSSSAAVTVDSSSATVTVDSSVASSTAVEVVPPQSVESSTAAAGVVTPGNVVESSTAGGVVVPPNSVESSTAAALGPFRALDPSVSPDGTTPTTPNGQFYLPADADSSFVVPAGATSITSATFTIVGANGRVPGNLVLFTSSNGGTHTAVGVSEDITPCATAGCTMTVGPLTFIDPLNGNDPVEVTGGQIVGLYLPAAVQNSFGYDTTAAGTFRAANFNKVIQTQTLTYVPLGASDFFTPAFNGALLFDVEYGYPTSSSTAGAAGVSSSSEVISTGVSSSSADIRRMASSSSSSSSTGPQLVDSSTIPAWVFNISSSGPAGTDCIPGLTCAAPHAALSSTGMILAAAVVALVAAFAQ